MDVVPLDVVARRTIGDRVKGFFSRFTSPNLNQYSGRFYAAGPRNVGGVWLTHEEALRLSAVWACVSVIAKTIASSFWDVFSEKPNGDRDYLPYSKTSFLLNVRPNPEMTPICFHECVLAVALLWGDSYSEIERDSMNRPVALWPLHPDRCSQRREEDGRLTIHVSNWGRPDTVLEYDDVYHIHGLGIDGSSGLDLVAIGARTFLQGLAMERFALKFYENGTAMGGVLTTDKDLDQKAIDALKKNVKERVAGVDNAFQFLVLSGGLKWQSLAPDLQQSQNTEMAYRHIEDVCRYFGVPPHKIAHLLRATFSNVEQQGIEFQRDGLTHWARRCEQEIDYKILPAGPVSVRINLDWAAEGDAKTKADTDSVLVQNGLMTRNQIARIRGRNSVGSLGDVLTVQVNMTTLDRVVNPPAPPRTAAGSLPKDDPAEPQEPAADNRLYETARALLVNALKRCMKRQTHRAEEAARPKKGNTFADRLEAGRIEHVNYIVGQLAEVVATCARVNIALGFSTGCAGNLCGEEHRMLVEAQARGVLASWCNIDERAEQQAIKLISEGSISA